MQKIQGDKSNDKAMANKNFLQNFREILRDTVLAHTASLIIFSVFILLMLKNPDSASKGLSIIFMFVIPLLTIATWLATSVFEGYGNMIRSGLARIISIFFHITFFIIITSFSVTQVGHAIAFSLSHTS